MSNLTKFLFDLLFLFHNKLWLIAKHRGEHYCISCTGANVYVYLNCLFRPFPLFPPTFLCVSFSMWTKGFLKNEQCELFLKTRVCPVVHCAVLHLCGCVGCLKRWGKVIINSCCLLLCTPELRLQPRCLTSSIYILLYMKFVFDYVHHRMLT